MLEMLINPKKAERRPWELFFVGAFYASLSILLVNWIFAQDAVLSRYSGILVVTFTVMFSMPFVYYTIRLEEKKSVQLAGRGMLSLLKEQFNFTITLISQQQRVLRQLERPPRHLKIVFNKFVPIKVKFILPLKFENF